MSVKTKENENKKNHRLEVLLDNFVDEDLQTMLKPLYIFQVLTLLPKYRIRNNFITPNGRSSYLASFLGTILYTFITCWPVMLLEKNYEGKRTLISLFIFSFFSAIYNSTLFIVNFISGLLYSDLNVNIILAVQEIHRFLNNETSSRVFTVWNWITYVCIFSFYILYLVYFKLIILTPLALSDISTIILVVIDIHVIYSIRIIKLLEIKVALWNVQALKIDDGEDLDIRPHYEKLFDSFRKILNCFEMCGVAFGYPVSNI